MATAHVREGEGHPDPAVVRVLTRFGIGEHSIEDVRLLASRATQQSLLVRAGGALWVLKRQTSAAAAQRLAVSHRLEERLSDVGFPVAPIRRSDSGRTVLRDGDAFYSLHGWVEGRQMAIAGREELIAGRDDSLQALASTLGRLHLVSAELQFGPEDPAPTSLDELLTAPGSVASALRRRRPLRLSRWDSLRLKRDKSTFDRWILSALPDVLDCATQLTRQTGAWHSAGPGSGLIHNDINWENLLFDENNRLVALLDFDNAIRAPWIVEVGSAAVVLAGAEAGRREQFVSSYEETVGAHMDRRLVEMSMALRCTKSILVSVNSYLTGNARDPELLAAWCSHLYASLKELRRR